jgi:hypothetical protein
MLFVNVLTYSFGYTIPTKQFIFNYTLDGESVAHQIFITAEESVALADMFQNHGPISFNTAASSFASAFRNADVTSVAAAAG